MTFDHWFRSYFYEFTAVMLKWLLYLKLLKLILDIWVIMRLPWEYACTGTQNFCVQWIIFVSSFKCLWNIYPTRHTMEKCTYSIIFSKSCEPKNMSFGTCFWRFPFSVLPVMSSYGILRIIILFDVFIFFMIIDDLKEMYLFSSVGIGWCETWFAKSNEITK